MLLFFVAIIFLIYLWARNMDEGLGYQRPRAYDLSYSKSLQEQAPKAGNKIRRGIKMMVQVEPKGDKPMVNSVTVGNLAVSFTETPEGLVPDKE